MFLRLQNLLLPADLAEIRQIVGAAQLADGAASGKASLKRNLQSGQGNPGLEQATQRILRALSSRQEFTSFALPRQITLTFNRYDTGMYYRNHMDAALMGGLQRQPLRADLAFTLFLSDPADYDGGELVIQSPLGEVRVKDQPGTALVYPASMLHQVSEVTRGVRLAAIGWVQSLLRDPTHRGLLHEVERLRHDLVREFPDSPYQERLDNIRENLLRLWAEA